jgi:YfiH family protein
MSPADIVLLPAEVDAAVAVQAADCLPILIADRRTRSLAAAHAGWRGLVARVPEATVEAMREQFGSRPEDLIVAVGPSIGPCCYEVGVDVRDGFARAGFAGREVSRWFLDRPASTPRRQSATVAPPTRPDHWYLDLWSAVGTQLEAVGVRSDQTFVAGLCTASHPNAFPSYRRDGRGAGRIAAVITHRRHP